jgi:hypothetical protein
MIGHKDFSMIVRRSGAAAETVAMGDLSRGQKQRDSMLKDFLRDRD